MVPNVSILIKNKTLIKIILNPLTCISDLVEFWSLTFLKVSLNQGLMNRDYYCYCIWIHFSDHDHAHYERPEYLPCAGEVLHHDGDYHYPRWEGEEGVLGPVHSATLSEGEGGRESVQAGGNHRHGQHRVGGGVGRVGWFWHVERGVRPILLEGGAELGCHLQGGEWRLVLRDRAVLHSAV